MVKPFRAEAELGAAPCLVREAKGYGRQKGHLERCAGSGCGMASPPKAEIGAGRLDEVACRIVRAARTGRRGGGKVFVAPMGWPDVLEL